MRAVTLAGTVGSSICTLSSDEILTLAFSTHTFTSFEPKNHAILTAGSN